MSKKFLLSIIAVAPLLAGCHNFDEERANQFQSLSQMQQQEYWQARKVTLLVNDLKKMGIAVYIVGDEYQILIPAGKIFNGNTPQLNGSATSVIQAVTKLINAQATPAVRILAYTNSSDSAQRNYSLTESWAETMVDRLRQANLTVGVISAQGHGDCDNIGSHSLYNNRIEIRYRISHGN